MAVSPEPTILPCGTDPRTLVVQVFDGEPPDAERHAHQASCPHCRATLTSLRSLEQDVERSAAERAAAPADFVRRVMARVRSADDALEVSSERHGATTVTEALVTRIARLAAMDVPHVTFALAELGTRGPAGLSVSLRLVVEYGVALHDVAAAVRRRVVHQVTRNAGLPVGVIDVLVEELSG
jgi:hypothetical protein